MTCEDVSRRSKARLSGTHVLEQIVFLLPTVSHALVQHSGGTGTLTNQAGAVEKTNYRALAPGFVNRAAWDLRPTAMGLVANAGSNPGTTLKPVAVYQHVASGSIRTTVKTIDIGAYESAL